MIRASIAAGAAQRRLPDVFLGNQAHVARQVHVDVVFKYSEHSTARVTSHVFVNESEHALVLLSVVGEDVLRAQEPNFFPAVEVPLDRVARLKTGFGEDSERFEDYDHTGAVVIGAWAANCCVASSGVEMCTEDDWVKVSVTTS